MIYSYLKRLLRKDKLISVSKSEACCFGIALLLGERDETMPCPDLGISQWDQYVLSSAWTESFFALVNDLQT